MKTIDYILLFLAGLSTSCIRDIDFNYNETSSQIVVNSLFTENEPWRVSLAFSKLGTDTIDHSINDATVFIRSENEELKLEFGADGVYTSESYPHTGTIYSLTVEVPGFEPVTATSSVPEKTDCSVEPFDTVFSKYMFPNDLLDYNVLPLTVNFNRAEEGCYRLVCMGYAIQYRYYITDQSVAYMRSHGLPEDILAVLSGLVGQYFDSEYFAERPIRQFWNQYGPVAMNEYIDMIKEQVIKEQIEEHDVNRFYNLSVFSSCNWLNNISSYTHAIVGVKDNQVAADILLDDENLQWAVQNKEKRNREYWLMIEHCSREFYEYYQTYALQVSQRLNPYADNIEVHSNIKNGVGIFAGYNRQMIHLFDY